MATISPTPIGANKTASRYFIFQEKQPPPQASSGERQELAALTKRIRQNLSEVNQFLEFLSENDEENDEDSYYPVPPRRSFKVKVRYQYRGRGEPLPYEFDEE